ncbi:hypothetical protein GCM10011608_00560 [Micromonospora sonchi]|uniref:Uncharacterized protein n=1 Tax=Micromonospora sonchi TaxID=1763543 RepID=A0A917TEY5_9ACTN|nr:hypothetical protein [Micromonospora sonchi]GGM19831.1 hypothetical protein GCM10011608_00560 [Micromonospora sonchi]
MADNPSLRGLRRLAAIAGTLVLSAGVITAGTAPASADEPERLKAVCDYRLCLLVLDKSTDKDGDGVTDVDEEALGSDPDDPTSRPEAEKIFDIALARELPSFEQHLTELVALPRNNRENTALWTGLGTIPFPERGPLIKSVDSLVDTLKTHGYKNFGTNMTVTLPERPKVGAADRLKFAANGNVALHGSRTDRGFKLAGILGVTSLGINGDRTPTHFTDHGFSYGERGSIGRNYSVGYGENIRDDVSTSMSQPDDLTITNSTVTSYKGSRESGHTNVTSESRQKHESDGFSMEVLKIHVETMGYDENGNPLEGSTTRHNSSSTNYPDGSSTWYTESTTTHRDKDGNVTGSETSTGKGRKDTDGKSKSETWDTTCDAAGNCGEPKYTCEGTECDDSGGSGGDEPGDTGGEPCQGEDCPPVGDETTGMPNPDSTGVGVVTPDDWARVAAFLNSTRTPDRNSDQPEIPDTPPTTGPYDPMVAMVDPDGVFTLSVTTTPDFNKAQPKYDPTLNHVIGITGVEPPRRQEPDPVSWP